MMANVSFYLTAILTLRVKSHLLQRNARRYSGERARRRSPRQNLSILVIVDPTGAPALVYCRSIVFLRVV